jgi:dihydrofolate reductase
MPPSPLTRPLTLVVATTPILKKGQHLLGIGQNGTLPWPRIKSDMGFFQRVTTRVLPRTPSSDEPNKTNAVIMGRKTYVSIPKSLRPLGKRVNVVVTRDGSGAVQDEVMGDLVRQSEKDALENEKDGPRRGAVVSKGLEDALQKLDQRSDVGSLWIMGGGEIYAAALRLPSTSAYGKGLRILMTRVKKRDTTQEGFECDTFFPLTDNELSKKDEWREVGAEELSGWVGEDVSPDWKDDGDVSIKVVGYERIS